MPVSTEFVEKHLSGCPLNSFGPCQTHKCYFFVAIPLELNKKERECLFLAQYFHGLTDQVLLQLSVLPSVVSRENSTLSGVPQRVAQTISAALASLAALQSHPAARKALKAEIKTLQFEIHSALKTFAESK